MTPRSYTGCTIIRWVDGDTVDIRVDMGFRSWFEGRFRLYGIDCPERGQPNHNEATGAANTMAPPGSVVDIRTYPNSDKYGRWLVEIMASGLFVNQELLNAGLAVPYFGGTKG